MLGSNDNAFMRWRNAKQIFPSEHQNRFGNLLENAFEKLNFFYIKGKVLRQFSERFFFKFVLNVFR